MAKPTGWYLRKGGGERVGIRSEVVLCCVCVWGGGGSAAQTPVGDIILIEGVLDALPEVQLRRDALAALHLVLPVLAGERIPLHNDIRHASHEELVAREVGLAARGGGGWDADGWRRKRTVSGAP